VAGEGESKRWNGVGTEGTFFQSTKNLRMNFENFKPLMEQDFPGLLFAVGKQTSPASCHNQNNTINLYQINSAYIGMGERNMIFLHFFKNSGKLGELWVIPCTQNSRVLVFGKLSLSTDISAPKTSRTFSSSGKGPKYTSLSCTDIVCIPLFSMWLKLS